MQIKSLADQRRYSHSGEGQLGASIALSLASSQDTSILGFLAAPAEVYVRFSPHNFPPPTRKLGEYQPTNSADFIHLRPYVVQVCICQDYALLFIRYQIKFFTRCSHPPVRELSTIRGTLPRASTGIESSKKQMPRNCTMCGWRRSFSSRHSCTNFSLGRAAECSEAPSQPPTFRCSSVW